jgi:hypothetical protein
MFVIYEAEADFATDHNGTQAMIATSHELLNNDPLSFRLLYRKFNGVGTT